jgi:hypothetical protein
MQTPDHPWTPDGARRTDPTHYPGQSRWLESSDDPSTEVHNYNVPAEPLTYERRPAAFSAPRWPLVRPSQRQAVPWNSFTVLFTATTLACVLVIILAVVEVVELRGAATGNAGAHSLSPTALPTTSPTATRAATFTAVDMTTQGNWPGVYGQTGYLLAGDAQHLPATIQVTLSGQSGYIWAASTADSRALQKASSPGDRIAACWYASTSFTIDVDLTDGQPRQMALYLVDWDRLSRSENVTVLDATTGAVLDTRSISTFANGDYLVWQIRGHVVVRVTNELGSLNAVVSGLFFS